MLLRDGVVVPSTVPRPLRRTSECHRSARPLRVSVEGGAGRHWTRRPTRTCLGLSPHDTTCPLRSEHAFRHVPMHRSMRAASRGTLIATSTASGRGVGAHGRAARFPGTACCQRHARCRHTRDVTLLPIVGCAPVPARCACRPRLRRFGLVERIAQCRFRDHRSTRPVMTVPLTPPIHPDRQASSYRTRSRGECRQKVEISIGTSRP